MDKLFNSVVKNSYKIAILISIAIIPTVAWGQAQKSIETSTEENQAQVIPNGVYLYGETTQPEQLGKEYFVFEIQQNQVVGALYLPHSEFSCVYGEIQPQTMNLSVVHPYTNQVSSFDIDVDTTSTVANAGDRLPNEFTLQGYQPIATISKGDRQMLNTCIQDQNR